MANAAQMKDRAAARILIVGYPGSGKTGAVAALANAGWNIRYLDYDGNYEPLFQYCTPEALARIDIVSCEDRLREGRRYVEVVGEPEALVKGWKMLDRWKYKNPDGSETDLGASREWGPDTILVLDSMTSMGIAAMRRAMFIKGKTPENNTDSTWGFAMAEQEALIEQLTSTTNRFHIVVLAHLKMISPKDVRKGDDDLTKELKQKAAEIIPTRLYPSALGQQLPPLIGGHFPTLLEAVAQVLPGDKVRRILRSVPRPELDLKLPTALPHNGEWPVATGLVEIMKLLGHLPPQGSSEPITGVPAAPQPGAK